MWKPRYANPRYAGTRCTEKNTKRDKVTRAVFICLGALGGVEIGIQGPLVTFVKDKHDNLQK